MTYDSSQIKVLEGLEPVRHRPGMYIGSTDTRGLHHMIWEIVDNGVDEALAGHCDHIVVKYTKDGYIEVQDNGRGIPVDIHPKTGKSALETVYTVLHAGGKFDKGAYKVSGGLHGVGASVVNALSEHLEVRVHKNGSVYYQSYHRGVPDGDVAIIGESSLRGTHVRFKADNTIFETTRYNPSTIINRLKQSAYLTPGVTFTYISDTEQTRFYFDGGINCWLDHMTYNHVKLGPSFSISQEGENVYIDIAARYVNSTSENISSFANNIPTPDGGHHVVGFKNGLLKAINEAATGMDLVDKKIGDFQLSDILEGLYAIISVKLPEPQFEGQTKGRLGNSYIKAATETVVYEYFKNTFQENPDGFKKIIEKISLSAKARVAARLARETVLRKTTLSAGVLPGKLADCSNKKKDNTEMFIVEGDSAGGTAKSGRNSSFQAILPLRGKILNTENIFIDKLLQSEQIKNLVLAIGAGIKDSFDVTKIRYDKIVIMTDADVDGAHIRTLLLTFFFRYMRPLIEEGHLYIAVSPLYKITQGKKSMYVYPGGEVDLAKIKKENRFSENADVQRYKGLGEMNAEQLWDTTMNPENRKLLKVTAENAEEADRMFRILMGDDVSARKNFILTHAKHSQLDI